MSPDDAQYGESVRELCVGFVEEKTTSAEEAEHALKSCTADCRCCHLP